MNLLSKLGQMLLAQALLDLHLGRDWFWTPETRYKMLINLCFVFFFSKVVFG